VAGLDKFQAVEYFLFRQHPSGHEVLEKPRVELLYRDDLVLARHRVVLQGHNLHNKLTIPRVDERDANLLLGILQWRLQPSQAEKSVLEVNGNVE
jgi:hypothetical protein